MGAGAQSCGGDGPGWKEGRGGEGEGGGVGLLLTLASAAAAVDGFGAAKRKPEPWRHQQQRDPLRSFASFPPPAHRALRPLGSRSETFVASVGVHHQQPCPSRNQSAAPHRGSFTGVLLHLHETHGVGAAPAPGVGLCDEARAVRRPVVDDDDLERKTRAQFVTAGVEVRDASSRQTGRRASSL